VPAWLLRVVARGLAATPDARWPSMGALLEALTHAPSQRRRQRLAIVAGVLAIVVLVALPRLTRRRESQLCRGPESKLAGVWDAARSREVHAAFVASGSSFAADAFVAVSHGLDDYARQWTGMSTDSCVATRVRGDQSEEVLDLRGECLEQRRRELSALTDILWHADRAVVEKGPSMLRALGPIDECGDVALLKLPVRPPRDPVARKQVDQARELLARAHALQAAGKSADALRADENAVTIAVAVGCKPVEAQARYASAEVLTKLGRYQEEQAEYIRASAAALAGHDDLAAAQAWACLTVLMAQTRGASPTPKCGTRSSAPR
jgi:hypothetical protein